MKIKKIIIAPDSFKGTLSSIEVCNIIEEALIEEIPSINCIKLPFADGGEGLVDAILFACDGKRISVNVHDPLWRNHKAEYAMLSNNTAVIEMSAASGLTLLEQNELRATKTTTYGTGELIADALKRGCKKIILGLGGSATIDGGVGAATALGIRFLSNSNNEISLCGEGLEKLVQVDTKDMMPELADCEIIIACDVDNPLCGKNGSAYVYGPQKGATDLETVLLDKGLSHLSNIIKMQTGKDFASVKGIGAAGGMALPFIAFTNASLHPGYEIVLDTLNFDKYLVDCNLIITGEGRTDAQSSMGKALFGITTRARSKGVPVIAISGCIGEGYECMYDIGITSIFTSCRTIGPIERILDESEANLKAVVKDVARLLKIFILN